MRAGFLCDLCDVFALCAVNGLILLQIGQILNRKVRKGLLSWPTNS